MGQSRIWKGVPSTTQLLNPTRIEYLQITKPYAIDPFDQAFALLGTRHHQMLEAVAKQLQLQSEKQLGGEITGILDLLEPLPDGTYRLTDYKTYGSYQVAKHLTQKGDGEYERFHLALQLNNYRLKVRGFGFNVSDLKVQITVRDGGTFAARNNHVPDKLYYLPVEILSDDVVTDYFQSQSYNLCTALERGQTPELCDYDGRWGGRRCKLPYCRVAMYCPEGAKVNRLELIE